MPSVRRGVIGVEVKDSLESALGAAEISITEHVGLRQRDQCVDLCRIERERLLVILDSPPNRF
jgi:hypothetical protein